MYFWPVSCAFWQIVYYTSLAQTQHNVNVPSTCPQSTLRIEMDECRTLNGCVN